MEMEETGIGRLEHKIEKLKTLGERTPGVEFLRSEVSPTGVSSRPVTALPIRCARPLSIRSTTSASTNVASTTTIAVISLSCSVTNEAFNKKKK